jgi:hypothetical protein
MLLRYNGTLELMVQEGERHYSDNLPINRNTNRVKYWEGKILCGLRAAGRVVLEVSLRKSQ